MKQPRSSSTKHRLIFPLKVVSHFEPHRFCRSILQLDYVACWKDRVIDLTRICSAWFCRINLDNTKIVVQPDHVERDQGVLHPEWIDTFFFKNEYHPLILSKRRAIHHTNFSF